MKTVPLYCYAYGNTVTVTPNKRNESDIPEYSRLIADKGKALADGERTVFCIDCPLNETDRWTEIDDSDYPEDEVIEP